jgi:hypothetical protein
VCFNALRCIERLIKPNNFAPLIKQIYAGSLLEYSILVDMVSKTLVGGGVERKEKKKRSIK